MTKTPEGTEKVESARQTLAKRKRETEETREGIDEKTQSASRGSIKEKEN